MHKTSYDRMNWFKNNYISGKKVLKILDVGSLDTSETNYNYKSIFNNPNWSYTGLDCEEGYNVDIVVEDIYNWHEIKSESYDVIISGQLFEHLEFFWLTMAEIERVLKPGGFCCIIAPSEGPKHGVSDTDCYRFCKDGMATLAKYADFEILHVSTNKEGKPWCDSCLVARKPKSNVKGVTDLEIRMGNLENKVDVILDSLKGK
ncbi:methyltransferase domain protein [Methanobrevibacter woesei]|uniref:Methyltransferase domain protein n=1 Tax=Methanobrevibacter woesei TaxID=190976 RepID=A0A2U1S9E1_9EURY|nr:class I SAM-dependent methyltransferase [Methanobrevibacter woesei]MCC9262074.1 class I SAM-dependent methyltransferase [Methanobrevibacter woesei]PWB87043.1 methyltransferase domain protein [Methanobrevibacter woesei]